MADLYAGRNSIPNHYARMKGLMDAKGLPYGRRTHTYKQPAGAGARQMGRHQPGGEAIH